MGQPLLVLLKSSLKTNFAVGVGEVVVGVGLVFKPGGFTGIGVGIGSDSELGTGVREVVGVGSGGSFGAWVNEGINVDGGAGSDVSTGRLTQPALRRSTSISKNSANFHIFD